MTERAARTTDPRPGPLRVLVVDDSERTQDAIVEMLRGEPGLEVVGRASDGEEALRLALSLRPGCVCLDLQMPRMDGFTFLRLLMARQPTPVLVVSSSSRKQDVFKALELGALEFVAKPDVHEPDADVGSIREDLLRKLSTIRALRVSTVEAGPEPERRTEVAAPARPVAAHEPAEPAAPRVALHRTPGVPSRLIVIGASTGGPGALVRLLAAMPRGLPIAYAVAQHLPEHFTAAFAERLARSTGFDVREARDGDEFLQGRVLVAPGGRHLRIVRAGGPLGPLRASVLAPDPRDGRRYCPSVDLLFESAAEAMRDRVCAVVLTGMGNDGRQGVARVKEAGGVALAESERTAVVYGMPRQAANTGKVDEVLSLEDIVARLRRFAEQRK